MRNRSGQAAIIIAMAMLGAGAAQAERQNVSVGGFSLANGRPTLTSDDGTFSVQFRALLQFDAANYNASGSGPDLESGQNLRRLYLGIQGNAFGDLRYVLTGDFGSSNGKTNTGRIQSAYLEYQGLAPFALRAGVYPTPVGLEDSTSASDTPFLERTAPSDVLRKMAGGDGREGVSLLYTAERLYAALSYTAESINEQGIATGQQAIVARFAQVAYASADVHLIMAAETTYLFQAAEPLGSGGQQRISFFASPEVAVDRNGTNLVSTGSLAAGRAHAWGVEAGAAWHNLFAQGGYFAYIARDRIAPLPDAHFTGWYLEGSWVLTGEAREYLTASGTFAAPKPARSIASANGWGAWELAARYSDLNLNDAPGLAGSPAPKGVRGGEQRAWTVGVNWYPNAFLRFTLDYQHIVSNAIASALPYAAHDLHIDALSLRTQFAL